MRAMKQFEHLPNPFRDPKLGVWGQSLDWFLVALRN